MADDNAPLPFGSPGTKPTFSNESRFLVPDNLNTNTIRDITNLVGAQVLSELDVRGELGGRTLDHNLDIANDQNVIRSPWVLTCQTWIQQGRYIVAKVNPREVQWRMPQRAVQQKTRLGEILHVWKDRFRGTFYDEPTIQLSFQSGNIMPIRKKPLVPDIDFNRQPEADKPGQAEVHLTPDGRVHYKEDPSETQPTVPTGLDNFYEFLQLVDEQKIQDNGEVNYVYILYNSRMFPNLTLAGLFTPEGVSWSDTSEDPNQVTNWSANFTIYDSYPRLNDLNTLREFFRQAGFGRI